MKNRKLRRVISRMLFALYIVGLLFLVFGADRMASSGYNYNLVLFSEIKRFIKYRHIVGYKAFLANVVGNFVVFMPFGFLMPTLTRYKYNFIFITMLSLEFSLLIEIVQLITRLGSFDVDDLLLNTLGGSAGYVLYKICRIIYDAYHNKNMRNRQEDKYGEKE